MRRKGIDFKRAPHLTWRCFNPETDIEQCSGYDRDYFDRNPHLAYCVIVPVSRCEVGDDGYHLTRESMDAAKCLPFSSWSRTNMVYGRQWRRQSRGAYFWARLSELPADRQQVWRDNAADHIVWDDEDHQDGQVAEWFDVYWTSTVYWVEDNRVYTASFRTQIDPNAEAQAA